MMCDLGLLSLFFKFVQFLKYLIDARLSCTICLVHGISDVTCNLILASSNELCDVLFRCAWSRSQCSWLIVISLVEWIDDIQVLLTEFTDSIKISTI